MNTNEEEIDNHLWGVERITGQLSAVKSATTGPANKFEIKLETTYPSIGVQTML